MNQIVNYKPEPNYSKIHQEDIIIINVWAPNHRDSKKVKQKLTEIEINK